MAIEREETGRVEQDMGLSMTDEDLKSGGEEIWEEVRKEDGKRRIPLVIFACPRTRTHDK